MYFDKGTSVNEYKYISFKEIIMQGLAFGTVEISGDLIREVFNPIKDEFTGMTISSSNKQFEHFCHSHGLKFRQCLEKPSYLIRKA